MTAQREKHNNKIKSMKQEDKNNIKSVEQEVKKENKSQEVLDALSRSVYESADGDILFFDQDKSVNMLEELQERMSKGLDEKKLQELFTKWFTQNIEKTMQTKIDEPKQFFKELHLRASTHPKINNLLKEAEQAWLSVSKQSGNSPDFAFIAFFLILFQNLNTLIKMADVIAKNMESYINLGASSYDLYKMEKTANEYIKSQGIELLPEQKAAIEEKLKNLWLSDKKPTKEEIKLVIDNVIKYTRNTNQMNATNENNTQKLKVIKGGRWPNNQPPPPQIT